MTAVNPPFALQNAGATHTAENDRLAMGSLIAGARVFESLTSRGGFAPAIGGTYSPSQTGSPSLAVQIGAGVAYVPGTTGAKQGVYACTNDGTVTIALDTAHGSLPRIDLIVVQVEDSAYAGAVNAFKIDNVTGTAASSPVAPAAPDSSLVICEVFVAANDTTITNGNITDRRIWIDQGIIPTTTAAKPNINSVAEGQAIFLRDTGYTEIKYSGAWQRLNDAPAIDIQTFTSSGTWSKPANAKSIWVRVLAGGGAGGGATLAAAAQNSCGSGGGSGGYGEGWFDAVALAASVTVTVGAGGTGVSANTGNTGSTSSFGTAVVAAGGVGGVVRSSDTTTFGFTGGDGGAVTAGTIQIPGRIGSPCWGTGQFAMPGKGADSLLGSGGDTHMTSAGAAQSQTGGNGTGYGAGGGGAMTQNGGTARPGGNGAPGVVVVVVFY